MKQGLTAILTVTLFFLFFSPSVDAEEYEGYLTGKTFYHWDNGTRKTTTNITDGNSTTQSPILSSSRYLSYEFDTPVDINSITYNISRQANDVVISFYDVSRPVNSTIPGTARDIPAISRITPTGVLASQSISVKKVKTLTISTVSSDTIYIREFNASVFMEGPDITPPANVGSLQANGSLGIAELTWTNPRDTDFSHVKITRDGQLVKDNLTDDYYYDGDLEIDQTYNYTIFTVDKTGNTSVGRSVSVKITDDDLTPPKEISSLSNLPSEKDVTFNFVHPDDTDFDKVNVYLNGVLIGSTKELTYKATGLDEGTSYSFIFKTVDSSGNESSGVVTTIQTLKLIDDVPPAVPTGLGFTVGNSSLVIDWDNNREPDLDGYNLYVDGIKVNATPIRSSFYNLTSLKNEQDYQISVSAIDTSSNESARSTVITASPSSLAMPVLKVSGYDLTDVAGGVGTWFSSLWLILAFSVAIPLAFYISNRIKLLFIS